MSKNHGGGRVENVIIIKLYDDCLMLPRIPPCIIMHNGTSPIGHTFEFHLYCSTKFGSNLIENFKNFCVPQLVHYGSSKTARETLGPRLVAVHISYFDCAVTKGRMSVLFSRNIWRLVGYVIWILNNNVNFHITTTRRRLYVTAL